MLHACVWLGRYAYVYDVAVIGYSNFRDIRRLDLFVREPTEDIRRLSMFFGIVQEITVHCSVSSLFRELDGTMSRRLLE